MTLFTSMDTLSYDVILRVFDGFAVAGWKQIFRVTLVILHLLQVRRTVSRLLLAAFSYELSWNGPLNHAFVVRVQHQILASSFEEIPQIFYDVQEHAVRCECVE